ncbi:MAG: GDSL-type esterase/lipase family protein [Pseudomonadota bacterium]
MSSAARIILIVSLLVNAALIGGGAFAGFKLYGAVSNFGDMFEKFLERQNEAYAATTIETADAVFLGDSITYEGLWEEYFPETIVVNRGVMGDTTQDILNRFDTIPQLNPSKLFLMIGINDLNAGMAGEDVIARYKVLFDRFENELPQADVFIQSVLPTNDEWDGGYEQSQILALNTFLKAETKARGFQYMDLHPKFVNENGELRRSLSNDGIHLTHKGYALWVDEIRPYVER